MSVAQSPSIRTREIDLTTVVVQASSSEAALAGQFNWGPVDDLTLVTSESELVSRFSTPDNNNSADWFTASNFLAYANKLWLVRVVDSTNANSSLRAKNASATGTGFLVKNREVYNEEYADGELQLSHSTGPWIAKYPGALGNSLKVSVCPSSAAFSSTLPGVVSVTAGSTSVIGTGTTFTTKLVVGDVLVINNEVHKVLTIKDDTSLTLDATHRAGATNATATRKWEFYNEVNTAPNTSTFVSKLGGSNDEMHVIVQDVLGLFSGIPGTILEKFTYVSKASDAYTLDGTNNYYVDVINQRSQYIWWAGHEGSLTYAGTESLNVVFGTPTLPLNHSLSGGSNGANVTENEKIAGYDFFQNTEETPDVSIILGSDAGTTLAVYIINNIAETRQDCVAFFSPPRISCVNNKGNEAEDIVAFRDTLPSTSYAALDGNWKYQYDRYNDLYRYVPCNGDVAGIHARTDDTNDAWWAAAGLNRGQMKNVVRLAWNPKQAFRDQLYVNGINPVVTFKNEGSVLFGQKTLQAKPSAFDRLNVRRLFNVLKKSISRTSRYFLFEFNDPITRTQFINTIEPFLRDVKGRRGITDYYIKCDEGNNTPYIIDTNQFIGSIFVKPNRVAEFITLNFVAVPTGVSFEEVVNQV